MKKEILFYIVLTSIASLVNYLVYPLLGRILPGDQYVEMTVSLTLLTQVTTFLSSIIAVTIGISKSKSSEKVKQKLTDLQSILFQVFLIIILFFLATSPLTLPLTHTPVSYSIPISIMMLLTIPITLISGYLNGKNRLKKLGGIILFSAILQATIGISAAVTMHNGLATIYAMCLAQIIAVVIIYAIIKEEHLPNPLGSLRLHMSFSDPSNRKLIFNVLAAGVSILALSLTQLLDLIVVQDIADTNIKQYTDLYIISRMVFFAGMIFIWPFLGQIDVVNKLRNRLLFLKLLGVFLLVSIITILAMALAGSSIIHILFGSIAPMPHILTLVTLSVVYKLCLLIITAVALYLIVLQRYSFISLCLLTSASLYVYSRIAGDMLSTIPALVGLNIIVIICALCGLLLVFTDKNSQK